MFSHAYCTIIETARKTPADRVGRGDNTIEVL